MSPRLTSIVIGDEPDAWTQAGFHVVDDHLDLGTIRLEFRPGDDHRGILSWGFDGIEHESIDGIATFDQAQADADTTATDHPNGIADIDHLVLNSDDLDGTRRALALAGFEERRSREVPGTDPVRLQVFYWAGDVVLELVGIPDVDGSRPTTIWGLALNSPDIDHTATVLGDKLSTPKSAVQAGRRIATLRTRELGISIPIAVMTPHVGSSAPTS